MKDILVSLKPYFYYLIGEGLKKVEVRKNLPKADNWSKNVLAYMSKDEQSFSRIPKEFQDKYRRHWGKIGLKFVCDSIETIEYQPSYYFCRLGTQLSNSEMWEYGRGKPLYGWHISDLVIYDKPRELREFKHKCNGECERTKSGKRCNRCDIDGYGCDCITPITSPPQSYCYVESEG